MHHSREYEKGSSSLIPCLAAASLVETAQGKILPSKGGVAYGADSTRKAVRSTCPASSFAVYRFELSSIK